MSIANISAAGLETLAGKLDTLDDQLDDDERGVLVEVFRLAPEAAGNPEVAAFGLPDFHSSVGHSFGIKADTTAAQSPVGTSFLNIFVPLSETREGT